MKRTSLCFLIAGLLLCLLPFVAPEAKAAGHSHCVCGGSAVGIGPHSCSTSTWSSLRTALTAKGMTPETADFGKLAAGNYYLDCDITVTGTTEIKKNISLCLNGHTVSRENGKLFGYLKNGYTLNICDCSGQQAEGAWRWKGSVNGGIQDYGSVIYTHYGSTLNIYGGNFTGKSTKSGVIVAANDGAPDLDGDGSVSNSDKNQATPSVFNFYNGFIQGSPNATSNSTVTTFHTAVIYWYGGQLQGGLANGVQDAAVLMEGDRLLRGTYSSLQSAVSAGKDGRYIRLISDLESTDTISGSIYLDLHGYHLSGVTVNGTLYVFDSATDSFQGNQAGSLSYTGKGTVCADLTTDITGQTKRYISLTEENGLSFHRIYVGITTMTLRPNQVGMGYTAQYRGDEAVQAALSGSKAYGYELWLDGYSKISRGKTPDSFTGNASMTLGLNNIMKQANTLQDNIFNADTQVHAVAYIKLADGRILRSAEHARSLKEITALADLQYDQYTDAKRSALQNLYSGYKTIMLGWDLPNTIHSVGTWTSLNQDNFASSIVKNGQYQLTSDIDLGDSSVSISSGRTVTLCLNGHTISGTNRLFKVYGTLNICDCHTNDQEGTLTSSYAGDYAPVAYLYQAATLNLYGGNLTATGKVAKNGGVLAIGNTNGMDCRFNMFGGRIYGGQAAKDAGLIWVLNTSTMNMYGGELYDGIASGNGGGIYMSAAASANLYGGKISNCLANRNGGAVCSTGEGTLHIGSRMVIESNSAGTGGNIYHSTNTPLTIDGASITKGNASMGGGIYSPHAGITLSGNTVIRDNQGGNLYLTADIALDAAGLTQGADVHIYNVSAMTVDTDFTYLTLEREGYKVANVGGQTVLIPQSFTVPADVDGFQVGFGMADITPTETGLPLAGYGNASERLSTDTGANAYDKLTVSTVAITDEKGETVLLMSVDLIRPGEELMATIFPAVSAATGVPESHIFTTFTHTHSVPETKNTTDPKIRRYNAMLPDRFAESANLAMADRASAAMETGSFEVGDYGKQLNFTRHYQYTEDGIVKYFGDNFGTATVNSTTQHVTEADHTMHLVKFTRDGKDILMTNWRVHPHMTGGSSKTAVSADVIGTTRFCFARLHELLQQDSNSGFDHESPHFIYLQGAAGNINENSKIPEEKHDYDYVEYGYDLAVQIMVAIYPEFQAAADLDVTYHLQPVETVGTWQVDNYTYTAISDIATDEEFEHAKAAKATYEAWLAENPNATSTQKKAKCEELGYLTWFHFNNVITRHSLHETYQLPLNTFALGDSLAFFTAPGELWDTVSMQIEENSPFAMTLCLGYSQDHNNYFVYDPSNGGVMTYESYESNNYRYVAPNTINEMIAYWEQTLQKFYGNT